MNEAGAQQMHQRRFSRRSALRLGLAAAGATMLPFAASTAAKASATRVTLPAPSGDDDAPALNAVLAGNPGAVVYGYPDASYTITSSLIIPSGTTLDMTGCTITLDTYVLDTIVRNQNATPARSVTDVATTAGSTTITSATAHFTSADVGAWVCIGRTLTVGAGFNLSTAPASAGGPAFAAVIPGGNVLTAQITKVVNSTTAVLSIAADLATTAQPMHIFGTRDSDITLVGGTWVRDTGRSLTAAAGGASIYIHSLVFRNVDTITISDLTVDYPIAGTGKYAISVGMATEMTISDIIFDTTSDGVHLQGPIDGGTITNITPADGPVSAVKLMGDKNTTLSNIYVSNVGGNTTNSGNGAIWIGEDDVLQEATFTNIVVDTVDTTIIDAEYLVRINGSGVQTVSLTNLTRDNVNSTKETIIIGPYNPDVPMAAREISLTDLNFTVGNVTCIGVGTGGDISTLVIDDFEVLGGAANGGTNGTLPMIEVSGATVGTLSVTDGTFSGSGDYLVRLNSSTSATVSQLNITDVTLSGFGDGGVVAAVPGSGDTHTLPSVRITGTVLDDMAWIFDIGAPDSGEATVTTEFLLDDLRTEDMSGLGHVRATGVVTVEVEDCTFSGTDWDVLTGGSLDVIDL